MYIYNAESRWDPPGEGFVSIEEQNQANNGTASSVRYILLLKIVK